MMSIAVVIVAYRSSRLLEDLLLSTLVDPQICEIVVVDNSSETACQQVVECARHKLVGKRVEYIDPNGNLGFARGCNLGARATRLGQWIAFVNPDVRLDAPLSDLLRNAEAVPFSIIAGSLGVRHGYPANARRRTTFGREILKGLVGARAYSGLEFRPMGQFLSVDQVDGALMIISREMFDRLGGFDEQFELYYEDVDICDRARALAPILVGVDRVGVHVGGASFREAGGKPFVALRVSRVRYLRKQSRLFGPVVAVVVAVVEFTVRSLLGRSEGQQVRVAALHAQLDELSESGAVNVLDTH